MSQNAAVRRVSGLNRYLPAAGWLREYGRDDLLGDLVAGLIVAIMLVPQGMAYALLAGLPPQVGLYASILPLILYGLLGTSRVLAVGPVAIVSLLVASGISPLAAGNPALYLQLAVQLALLVGLIQIGMGFLRIGFLVNFLSHPVLVGFTAAAAILIGFSQLKHVLGYPVPRTETFYEQVFYTLANIELVNGWSLFIGVISILILLLFRYRVTGWLERIGLEPHWANPLARSAPLLIVVLGTILVTVGGWDQSRGVAIVGEVPAGLPSVTLPSMAGDGLLTLLPLALAISFVGYMESISVAKALASRRRQKIDADQELIALGAANLGAAITGGYPVTGGFSRSGVNFSAGARTGMASIITALLIAITVTFLTPSFYYLPNAVLSAIILVAVVNLVDLRAIRNIWRFNRGDGAALTLTFVGVLALGVEMGIFVGVGVSILFYIWRTSKPHVAVVGRIGKSESYRNIERYQVQTWPSVIALRVDESLYFANTRYLEETVLALIADQPDVKELILIWSAVNYVDASALETLEALHGQLRSAGVTLHLAEIKGPVLERLDAIGFVDSVGPENIHFSTHDAFIALGHVDADDHTAIGVTPGTAAARIRYVALGQIPWAARRSGASILSLEEKQ